MLKSRMKPVEKSDNTVNPFGQPEKELLPFWHERSSISVANGLLLHGSRIVVPPSLRADTLKHIHEGHQGIVRCQLRMRMSVWWPGISSEVANMVEQCRECSKNASRRREPLLCSPVPEYPWQMVGSDLFTLNGDQYRLVADYFSRYPEVVKLNSTTSQSIITQLRSIFARHGIPETLRCDNGPQYSLHMMDEFVQSYGFQLVTSSPHFPQSNGFIERMVKTVKRLLSQSSDHYLTLLSYRTAPLPWCGKSPCELLMGHRLRSNLPQTQELLIPQWPYLQPVRKSEKEFKLKQKKAYDKRHRVTAVLSLSDDTPVWVRNRNSLLTGKVLTQASTPPSYLVETPSGILRRNRLHLGVVPDDQTTSDISGSEPENTHVDSTPEVVPAPQPIMTRSRTGTSILPPMRYRNQDT